MTVARQPNLLHPFILLQKRGKAAREGDVTVNFVSVLTCGLKHRRNPETSLSTMQRGRLTEGIRNDGRSRWLM